MRRSVPQVRLLPLRWVIPWIALSVAFVSREAIAQNPRSVLIGGRTATMGGAGTAAGNDSAMPYLNPAGLAGVPGDVFAVSASVYSWTSWKVGTALAPQGFPADLGPSVGEDRGTRATGILDLPSSVMYFKHLSLGPDMHAAVGMSLVIPSSSGFDLIATRKASFPSNAASYAGDVSVVERSSDYYLGPAFAIDLGGVRLGGTVYGLYTKASRAAKYSDTVLLANGTFPGQSTSTFFQDATSMSLVAVLGAQVNLVGKLWAGAAVATPSVSLGGTSVETAAQTVNQAMPQATTPTFTSHGMTADRNHTSGRPLRVNVGLAYEDRSRFSLAGDVGLFLRRADAIVSDGPEAHTDIVSGQPTRTYVVAGRTATNLEQVIDVSLGGEIVISSFALRFGAFTDLSQRKPFQTLNTVDILSLRGDRVGGTLGLGTIVGSFDSTIGIAYTRTTGQLNALDLTNPTAPGYPVGATANTVTFIISGAVTAAGAKKTITDTLPGGTPSPLP